MIITNFPNDRIPRIDKKKLFIREIRIFGAIRDNLCIALIKIRNP